MIMNVTAIPEITDSAENSQAHRTQDQEYRVQKGSSSPQPVLEVSEFVPNVPTGVSTIPWPMKYDACAFVISTLKNLVVRKTFKCAVNHQHASEKDVRDCNAETQGYSFHFISPNREIHMDVNESNKQKSFRSMQKTEDGEEEYMIVEEGEPAEEHAFGQGTGV